MTRRVGEPAQERKARQGVWGVEDIRKRPAPLTEAEAVAVSHPFAWMAWFDGDDVPDDTIFAPPNFDEGFINTAGLAIQPGTGGDPLLQTDLANSRIIVTPGNVTQYIWTVTVTAVWSDSPPASGLVMIGNLVGAGGAVLGNNDVHQTCDASVLITHGGNQAQALTVVRGNDRRTPDSAQTFEMEVYQNTGGNLFLGGAIIECVGVPVDYNAGTFFP